MPDLLITQGLPNPPGKDRTPRSSPTNDQLNAEWMEFANASGRLLSLSGVTLAHYTFDARCAQTGEDAVFRFIGNLESGYSVRVHSGQGVAWQEGATHHVYLGRSNFAWNNLCGDTAVLRTAQATLIDWASYGANPSEGQVLRRVPNTNRLEAFVPA